MNAIDELRALYERATPGPWRREPGAGIGRILGKDTGFSNREVIFTAESDMQFPDVTLVIDALESDP